MENNQRDLVYVAALLHDIGKFWQRADESAESQNNSLSEETKNLASIICKTTQNGYYSHQHVLWTAEFFERKKKLFSMLKDAGNASVYHHNPSNETQSFIQLADWWSSGIDRSYSEEGVKINHGKQQFRRQILGNIFSSMLVAGENGSQEISEERKGFKLAPLSIAEDSFFPVEYIPESANAKEDYKKLWDSFFLEFDNLPSGTTHNFADSLFYLLKKYCWRIPAATNEDFPFTSLFDHLKITAAIAWSLYRFKEEIPDGLNYDSSRHKIQVAPNRHPLLLVCVDLSGIQKFIYDISSRYAAKSLRGRSFYLQALLDDVSREILQRTGAFQGNIVYSSGGKFYMILPNTDEIKKIIEDIEKEMSEKLWDKYHGRLFLCIGHVGFAYQNQMNSDKPKILIEGVKEALHLGDLWKHSAEAAAAKKSVKFKDLITSKEKFSTFFEPSGEGGIHEICAVTGLETKTTKEILDPNESLHISYEVVEQKHLGEILPKHKYLVFASENSYLKNKNVFEMVTGHKMMLDPEVPKIEYAEIYKTLFKGEPEFLNNCSPKSTYGFRYFGGTSYPVKINGEPKTFEDLVGDEGFKRIAILRMDVDNLGQLFIKGFGKEQSSFSSFATLSSMLDLFFSGYINTIRDKPAYKDWLTIIYSGGDDLFVIGRWDKAILFADEVQRSFKRFTGRNDITISAGIEMVGAKFPVAKAAELAGAAEKIAKNHTFQGKSKNSLALFGIPLNWDLEYPRVLQLKNMFIEWLDEGYITKGFLMQLLSYYTLTKRETDQILEKSPDYEDHSWKWEAVYNIARRKNATNDENKKRALDELKNILFTEIYNNKLRFEAFAVVCRWAELEYRMKSN